MTTTVTIEDILDLLPIVADREWSVDDQQIRDADGRCPICALVHEIDPTSHFSLLASCALEHINVDMGSFSRLAFIRAADSVRGNPVLRTKILTALEMPR